MWIDVLCSHCGGRRGTCHLCHGTGRIDEGVMYRVVGWIWALPGCECDACRRAGPQPFAQAAA